MIIGFGKVITSPYTSTKNMSYEQLRERIICWVPCILEYNSILPITNESREIIIGTPTYEKVKEILKKREDGFEEGLRSKDIYIFYEDIKDALDNKEDKGK